MGFVWRAVRRGVWGCALLLALGAAAGPLRSQAPQPPPPASSADAQRLHALHQQVSTGLADLALQRQQHADEFKAAQKDLLEAQRKSIDWWIGALAIGTTVAAAFGTLLPFLFARKDKEALQAELRHAQGDRDQIRQELQSARALVESIRGHEKTAATVSSAMREYQSGAPHADEVRHAVQEEARALSNNPQASDTDRLRARAVQASQVEQPDSEQAHAAYELWQALTILDRDSASAHFNAGYWAQALFEQSPPVERAWWLSRLQQHYAQALRIEPGSHLAAYNWGNALDDEAKALPSDDLAEKRLLWARAGGKYQQSLSIKTDLHEAANNWGLALAAEAKALPLEELAEKRRLWAQSGEKFALALSIQSDRHGTASNWGAALAAEALALPDEELAEKRRLWKLAGEKYQFALTGRPDEHQAANNWCIALLQEFHALSEPAQRQALLAQATALLERHAAQSAAAADAVAYNRACCMALAGDAAGAVAQLQRAAGAATLAAHWQSDKDLDPIRATPEFLAWAAGREKSQAAGS